MKILIFVLSLICWSQIAYAQDKYNASVVEIFPKIQNTPKETIAENVERYVNLIRDTDYDDIIVFPEYGLTSLKPINDNALLEYAIEVPAPDSQQTLCSANVSLALKALACLLNVKETYAVINVLEKESDNKTFYNTNLVFDRRGALIAKYRKINLYGPEKSLLTPGKDAVTFETDFGVTFGTFTCYDILFKFPALDLVQNKKVEHIVFPTAWFAELPFLSALSAQNGYAISSRVTLLGANYNNPSTGSGGSGIYSNGQSNVFIASVNKVKVIKQKVEKNITLPKTGCVESDQTGERILDEDITSYITKNDIDAHLDNYKFSQLQVGNKSFSQELEHKGMRCSFKAETSTVINENHPIYKFAVFSDGSSSACGIVSCTTSDDKSCGTRPKTSRDLEFSSIDISSNIVNSKDYVFPSTLNYDLKLLSYKFCPTDNSISIGTNVKQSGLITFGFYSIGDLPDSAASISLSLFLTVSFSIYTLIKYMF